MGAATPGFGNAITFPASKTQANPAESAGLAPEPPALPGGFCPVCGRSYPMRPDHRATCPRDGSALEDPYLSFLWLG